MSILDQFIAHVEATTRAMAETTASAEAMKEAALQAKATGDIVFEDDLPPAVARVVNRILCTDATAETVLSTDQPRKVYAEMVRALDVSFDSMRLARAHERLEMFRIAMRVPVQDPGPLHPPGAVTVLPPGATPPPGGRLVAVAAGGATAWFVSV